MYCMLVHCMIACLQYSPPTPIMDDSFPVACMFLPGDNRDAPFKTFLCHLLSIYAFSFMTALPSADALNCWAHHRRTGPSVRTCRQWTGSRQQALGAAWSDHCSRAEHASNESVGHDLQRHCLLQDSTAGVPAASKEPALSS